MYHLPGIVYSSSRLADFMLGVVHNTILRCGIQGVTGSWCVIVHGPQYTRVPVAPVAYQVILEPGIGQFREFEPRRVHTRINSLGLFHVDKLTCRKRESVS